MRSRCTPLRPDYNLPAKDLSIQSEFTFQIRLGFWLSKLKRRQPERNFIYYVGATHHYFILIWANALADYPFTIIHEIPPHGIRDYATSAQKLRDKIYDLEDDGIMPLLKHPNFDQWIKKIGGYSNRKFWESIQLLQKAVRLPKSRNDFSKETLKVTTVKDFKQGFDAIYQVLLEKSRGELISFS